MLSRQGQSWVTGKGNSGQLLAVLAVRLVAQWLGGAACSQKHCPLPYLLLPWVQDPGASGCQLSDKVLYNRF